MARSPRRRAMPLLLLAHSLWWSSAHAQTAADRETARLLMDRADEQVERRELEAALALYLGAHEIMHVPTTGIEVAKTRHALGRLVEARDSALEVLRMPAIGKEPPPFTLAREAAVQLARELEELIPVLSVEIVPAAAANDASLTIDGNAVPKAARSLPHALDPASHRIQVSAPGFHTVERSITLQPRERSQLRIEMSPLTPTDVRLGKTVPATRSRDRDPLGVERAHPMDRSSPWRWPLWAGVGIGGVGVLVGSIAGVTSLERASAAKRFCQGNSCTLAAQADRDAALSTARISNIGFAVGAVGAAVAIGSWWFSKRAASGSNAAFRLTLIATPAVGVLEVGVETL